MCSWNVSACAIEVDFCRGFKLAPPQRASLGAVIFDYSLTLNANFNHNPDSIPNINSIKPIEASTVRGMLSEGFRGNDFMNTSAMFQGQNSTWEDEDKESDGYNDSDESSVVSDEEED